MILLYMQRLSLQRLVYDKFTAAEKKGPFINQGHGKK